MKALIQKVIFGFQNGTYLTDQVKWELKKLAQHFRKLQRDLETKIKNLEQNITNEDKFNEYKSTKDELENFYDNIASEIKIRSKLD